MNDSKKILIPVLFLFSCLFASSQIKIKAQIICSANKEAIPFASVFIKSNPIGVQSDANGWFNLSSSPQETIFIRCLGYQQKSINASEVISKNLIELDPDTIKIGEITIFAETAYQYLIQARDSTNKYQMKSFKGICNRHDELSINNNVKRKSDSKIFLNVINIKNEHDEVDYWLDSIHSQSFGKISEQPYLAYPNTIPINLFSVKWPSKEERSNMKCSTISNKDNLRIIKVIRTKPTKNLVNQAIYYINKQSCVIEGIEYIGNFEGTPVKKSNRYHYFTGIKLTYKAVGDSCVLDNFNYKLIFSHRKIDPMNLWEYSVNMKITTDNIGTSLPQGQKLHRLDYLLFKKQTKK